MTDLYLAGSIIAGCLLGAGLARLSGIPRRDTLVAVCGTLGLVIVIGAIILHEMVRP